MNLADLSHSGENGSACLMDANPVVCCVNTLICIPYDWTAVFAGNELDEPLFDTTTSISTYYTTTYETVNAPSSTVMLTETVTETTTLTNVNYAVTVATASDGTITSVYWVTATNTNPTMVGNPTTQRGSIITQILTDNGTTLTLVGEIPGTQSTLGSSSTAPPTVANTSSTNDIGMKAGIGLGVTIAVALFGLLFFLIFRSRRRRNPQGDDGARTGAASELATSERLMSNLPQDSPLMGDAAAAEPVAEMKANEIPTQTRYEVASDQQQQHYADRYDANRAVEITAHERYELPSPVHEMHELPGYYGA
jgi:hypothetical protein